MKNIHCRFLILALFLSFLASCGGGGSGGNTTENPPIVDDNPVVDDDEPVVDDEPTVVSAIESVVLVEGSDLNEVAMISDGETYSISDLPDTFNFVANPGDESSTGSVAIEINGCADLDRTENIPPYTLQAEGTGFDVDDFAANPADETCLIALTPYELDNEQGEAGPTLEISFTVAKEDGSDPVDPPIEPNQSPVVELLGDETLYVAMGGLYNEPGATATDPEDGNISDDIVIGGDQVNTLIVATYLLSYTVTDSGGAAFTAYRSVVVQGNQPPQISIIGSETTYVNLNEGYADLGAEASDVEDGDITSEIISTSNVDTSTEGEYEVSYSVTDSNGDSADAVRSVIVTSGQASNDVNASILSLTRVDGVSPETIYFSAEESTCSGCDDIWGLNTTLADAYSTLSYHFSFDDSDSGSFATTGKSRNLQVGPAPRAAHTFSCLGSEDPNWDASDQRCEFDVGVRVQTGTGDYSDAYIRINIQPQFGPGAYYSDADIYCVSSTSNFDGCPHSNSARHLTDTPAPDNNNFDGSLILFHSNGATYSEICTGADEQHVRVATYGSGARPIIPRTVAGGNPNNNCNGSFNNNATISDISSNNMLSKDSNGHLIEGYGFDQVFTGLRIGEVELGETHSLIGFHDIDMDWSDSGAYSSYFQAANGADGCIEDGSISCDNLHYPYALSLTDSVLAGHDSNLPGVNFGAYNGSSLVNSTIMGVEMNRAVEHNVRIMGAWGAVISNNWLRGNHVASGGNGGGGGKHRLTLRAASATGVLTDVDKNPEDFDSNGHIRGDSDENEYLNSRNMIIDNWFNQDAASQDPEHETASWAHLFGHWMIVSGNTYLPDNGESDGTLLQVGGGYIVARTLTSSWPAGHSNKKCSLINGGGYSENTLYLDSSTIHFEDPDLDCTSTGDINFGMSTLAAPGSPGD